MHNLKQILFGAAVVALPIWTWADDYLLYWQVLDTATIDGVTLDIYVSTYAQAHNFFDEGGASGKFAGARTVFFDAGGNGPALMNIYNYVNMHWTDSGYTDTYINDEDVPTRVVGTDGGMYSHFTASDASSLSFAIELGNWENGEWVTLATSGTMSYNDLTVTYGDGVHILQMTDTVNLGDFQPWTPNAYSVPEPSSGLLVLIGASLLALKRRRC